MHRPTKLYEITSVFLKSSKVSHLLFSLFSRWFTFPGNLLWIIRGGKLSLIDPKSPWNPRKFIPLKYVPSPRQMFVFVMVTLPSASLETLDFVRYAMNVLNSCFSIFNFRLKTISGQNTSNKIQSDRTG